MESSDRSPTDETDTEGQKLPQLRLSAIHPNQCSFPCCEPADQTLQLRGVRPLHLALGSVNMHMRKFIWRRKKKKENNPVHGANFVGISFLCFVVRLKVNFEHTARVSPF